MFTLADVSGEVHIRIDQSDPDIPKLKKHGVYELLKAAFDVISQAVSSGEDVSVPGFGRFKNVTQSARNARNPKTGETIKVPEKQVVRFSASSALREAVFEGGKKAKKTTTKKKKKK